jgi:4-hydroxythreonine-4-phosphate dehydrogenase
MSRSSSRAGADGHVGPAPLPLAVTMGDPAGIGLDIVLSAWADRQRMLLPPLVVIGDPNALAERAGVLGLSVAIEAVSSLERGMAAPAGDRLTVLSLPLAQRPIPGRPDPANAPAVIAAIERAVAETVAGRSAAIVTAPISKATVYAAGFAHPGHTEFLAALATTHFPGRTWTPVMMLAADELRVVPVTVHMPLAAVPRALSVDRIAEVCRITARDLSLRFGLARPRIAVAGLNPHAGEGGSLGTEEIETIAPAIARLRQDGLDITGPHSADTLFHAAARARYDVAICMYHDQALIPLKTLAFDTGVNVTLGLPFVRTSPDHGTAFDIAGTGRASPASLVAALRLAARMASAASPP